MKRLVSYIVACLWLLAGGCLGGCSEDFPIDETEVLQGVDRNKVVKLCLPFTAQQGMNEVVISRTATDMDAALSSVLVMVYEAVDPNKPELNKLIRSGYYTNPVSADQGSTEEGWFTKDNDRTKGVMRMTCPVGDVYIYMFANWTNAFIDFAPGMDEEVVKDYNQLPRTQQELFEKFVPTWNGNVDSVDGMIPMIATVNNSSGLCKVASDGKITYFKDGVMTTTSSIASDINTVPNESNSFNFKRLMAKLTMRFVSGTASSAKAKFVPSKYILHNGAVHISPTTSAWKTAGNELEGFFTEVKDSKLNNFNTLTPNEFTIYLPENLPERPVAQLNQWTQRELMVKENGKNSVYRDGDALAGKFVFANAPKFASYVEVMGTFEDPAKDILGAEMRFFIHLGDFGSYDPKNKHDYNDFNVKRDHHYTINVTVNGVDDIIAESKDTSDEAAGNTGLREINPAADGLVYIGGLRAYCDSHYDQVEFEIGKSKFEQNQDFAVIFANTPFGSVSLFYYPANGTDRPVGVAKSALTHETVDIEQASRYMKWVRMRKQTKKGEFAKYPSSPQDEQELVTIFEALDEVWKANDEELRYYTCFLDEYYYTEHPLDRSKPLHLSDFVNKADRSIALGRNIHISKDGNSVSVDAITVVYQKSIACFYDLNQLNLVPYGVETFSETGKHRRYGATATPTYDDWDGRHNSLGELQNMFNTEVVNWKKNGWLISQDGSKLVDSEKNRLLPEYQDMGLVACLTKNRDFNGDGYISANELRWYNPSLSQLLGIWIGEPALPTAAALYRGNTRDLKSATTCEGAIFSSSPGVRRVLWSEQGCSFGTEYGEFRGEMRAVRNLGKNPTDFVTVPDKFYTFNATNRTIEVLLSDVALREFSPNELAPHHERSTINRVFKKIQLADHPYTIDNGISHCDKDGDLGPEYYFTQLVHSTATEAKTVMVTKAANYDGKEPYNGKKGDWRLPNQRELALMVMAVGSDFQVAENINEEGYRQVANNCHKDRYHTSHVLEPSYNYVLHCRTKFSNCKLDGGSYTDFGFMYNTRDNMIQTMWTIGDDLGMGVDGIAGYFCVRDVQ